MIKNRTGVILLFILLFSAGVQAQRVISMRINEILVINEDNFVDDYGKRNGWVELYNSSAGTVNIGGCFLTDDPNNPQKYPIPKGDVLTKIPPRQHILFWADGDASKGTFHLNFKLDPSRIIILHYMMLMEKHWWMKLRFRQAKGPTSVMVVK